MKTTTIKALALKSVALACLGATLSGCAVNSTQRVNTAIKDVTQETERLRADTVQQMRLDEEARRRSQEVNKPFVTGQSVPLARAARMPPTLARNLEVTALFSDAPVDLSVALAQVSRASGIVITATPDALMPSSAFGARHGAAVSPVGAPPKVVVRASGIKIFQVLDDIAAQSQTNWRTTATGAEFFRVETKSYELMTLPTTVATSAGLGKASGASSGGFSSDGKTSFSVKDSNDLDAVRKTLEQMMSAGGKFILTPESQMVTLTDTPEVHARVQEFIEQQNKTYSRRVRLFIEAIEVISKDASEMGFDWNLVYNTTAFALNAASPPTLTSSQVSGIGFQSTIGPFAGSSAAVRALNEVGTVVSRRSFPVVTTSGKPVTQALRTTFNYVDQVQTLSFATGVAGTSTQAPTVSQKDETVGTFLTLVPIAKPNGTVFLNVSFDVTTADPLKPFTVGSGASSVTIQQKTINGSGVIQELPIRAGRTEIIGGLEYLTAQSTTRQMADFLPAPLGGSKSQSRQKTVTVLLVTAAIEEGI